MTELINTIMKFMGPRLNVMTMANKMQYLEIRELASFSLQTVYDFSTLECMQCTAHKIQIAYGIEM